MTIWRLPEGNTAVAAAAIVTASLGGVHDRLPEGVVARLAAGRDGAPARDARLGLRALDRVTGTTLRRPVSGRNRLPAREWSRVVDVLRHRLKRAAT